MEILAVINAIKYIKQHYKMITDAKIVSDSQYVIGLISRQSKFEASDFTTKAGNEIRNVDLVKELLHLVSIVNVEFVKIKAHQKATEVVNYNIEVDKLSRQLVREAVKKELLCVFMIKNTFCVFQKFNLFFSWCCILRIT